MVGIRTEIVIDAPPDAVWSDVEDLASHVEWMHDAVAIRFVDDQRSGVGTVFDCDTRIGPLRTTDRMRVTEWEPGRAMGVRHEGLFTGEGRFELLPEGEGATRFRWSEELEFPWWFGGPAGAVVAKPILGWVWRRNLTGLKARVEGGPSDD